MSIDYAKLVNDSVARRRRSARPKAVRIPKQLAAKDHGLFFGLLKREGLPIPETEYRFHPTRRWAMDYCFVDARVFIEVDGGVFVKGDDGQEGGRHNRGAGWLKDSEKLNAAAAMGFRHLRCLPRQLCTLALIATIRETLDYQQAVERGQRSRREAVGL